MYIRRPIHVSGLLINLWELANPLFVRDKYVTPTGKRLHAGYVQKAEARKTYHLIPQLAVNNTCVWFNCKLVNTQDNYFDTTVCVYMFVCVHACALSRALVCVCVCARVCT